MRARDGRKEGGKDGGKAYGFTCPELRLSEEKQIELALFTFNYEIVIAFSLS